MGNCAGCSMKKEQYLQTEAFWKEPADTEKYSFMNLPKLLFHGSIANFKIKKCSYGNLGVRFEIQNVDTFFLKDKEVDYNKSAKWLFDQNFSFSMTEYELRKTFLKVELINQQEEVKNVVGFIQINMYLISTGPYHQDFSIKLRNGEKARISFDMKVSQIIKMEVQALFSEIDLVTQHPGEKFCFSIKATNEHSVPLKIATPFSYTVKVMLDNKEKQLLEKKELKQIQMNRRKSKNAEKNMSEGENLVWTQKDELFMPSVQFQVLVSELHHTYFQIFLWKIQDIIINKEESQHPEYYGECYIATHKLLNAEMSVFSEDNKEREEREVEVFEKIWHHGKKVATGRFRMKIKNDTYMKQMQVCVRTEVGIQKYSLVLGEDNRKESKCEQLHQLVVISEEIQSSVISLSKLNAYTNVPNFQCRKLKLSIENNLQKLEHLLEKSSKQSIVLYSYSSQKEMMKAQKLFIDLGVRLMSFLNEEDGQISELCWKNLIALLKRGQFALAHIGFNENQRESIMEKQFNKKLQNKVEIGLSYKGLLYKLLEVALNSLNYKGSPEERTFSEMFCAYAYFCIPQFRKELLYIIIKEEDPEISEWRGIQFSLQDENCHHQIGEQLNTFTLLFDWSDSFHKCLENQQSSQALQDEMGIILKKSQWRDRISKRGPAFFYFVKYWVQYIESNAIKTKDIQWKYFPGYNKIVKCFLVELKNRQVLEYPDSLKEACFQLLYNEKLLNSFVIIVYRKANMFKPLTVLKAVEFTNYIFVSLEKNNRQVPTTFHYLQFYKGLKLIIEHDFYFASSKAIAMIHNHFQLFSPEFRKTIALYLLGKVFFHLFLHWSSNVRKAFQTFFVMRIYRQIIQLPSENQPQEFQEELRIRFQKLTLILENALKLKEQEDKTSFKHIYEKDLYKKLKKKLMEKRRRKKNSIDSIDSFMETDNQDPPSEQQSQKLNSFYEKYSLTQLSRRKEGSRHQSQILNLNQKVMIIKNSSEKEDEVTRVKSEVGGRQQLSITPSSSKRKIVEKINSVEDQDFEIGCLTPELVEYLPVAMQDYKKIELELLQHASDKNWKIPRIEVDIELDKKELKPQNIEDW